MVGPAQRTFLVAVGEKYHIHGDPVTSEATSCLRNYLWCYVCWGGSWRKSCLLWKEERFHSLLDHLSCRWLQCWHPSMLVVQNLPPRHWWLVSAVCWTDCLLRASILLHGIPSPPSALPSFKPASVLAISSMVGISSRLFLVMRCGMLSRASWSMSPGTMSSFWKWSFHLATTLLLLEKVSIPSVDFRCSGPFFLGPHTSFSQL